MKKPLFAFFDKKSAFCPILFYAQNKRLLIKRVNYFTNSGCFSDKFCEIF